MDTKRRGQILAAMGDLPLALQSRIHLEPQWEDKSDILIVNRPPSIVQLYDDAEEYCEEEENFWNKLYFDRVRVIHKDRLLTYLGRAKVSKPVIVQLEAELSPP